MNNKIIIYDNSCPLCAAYTSAFVKTGLLTKEGRQDFSSVAPSLLENINMQRAVDEIPLVDPATQQVWYGIDALLEILQQKIPFAKKLGNFAPIKWALKKLYKLISYNRRVIVAGSDLPGQFDCTPHFNHRYRILLVLVLTLLNALLLMPLHAHLFAALPLHLTEAKLMAMFAAFTILNLATALTLPRRLDLEFLGQTVLLATIVLLLSLPLAMMNSLLPLPTVANGFLLGIIACVGSKAYLRRMRFAGMLPGHCNALLLNNSLLLVWIIIVACTDLFR